MRQRAAYEGVAPTRFFGEVEQPVPPPRGPVRIVPVSNAVDRVVGLRGLVQKLRDSDSLAGSATTAGTINAVRTRSECQA